MNLEFLIILITVTFTSGQRIVCYYTNWAQYRPGIYQFLPENIDPNLCTHIVYAFAWIQELDVVAVESNDPPQGRMLGMYKRVIRLKKRKPSLKVLIAISSGRGRRGGYHLIGANPTTRATFANNVVAFLVKYEFDGLDLNWLYPSVIAVPTISKTMFIDILRVLKRTMNLHSDIPSNKQLILSVSLSGLKYIIDTSYAPANISMYADFISIMAFDYHGPWESYVSYAASLYPASYDILREGYFNVDWIAQYYMLLGVPKLKINIGLPFFGRTYTLRNSTVHRPRSAAVGPGRAGPITRSRGFVAYYEVTKLVLEGYAIIDDPSHSNRYLWKRDQWVSYDDLLTNTDKVCYTKLMGYGGVAVRSLDLDNFVGGKYTLLRNINTVYKSADICQRHFLHQRLNSSIPVSCSRCVTGDHWLLVSVFIILKLFNI